MSAFVNAFWANLYQHLLTHWGRVTLMCISKLTIIDSDRRQAIIWTNARIFLIGPLGTNFSKILIEIDTFSFIGKMHLKMSFEKWRPFYLGLIMLRHYAQMKRSSDWVLLRLYNKDIRLTRIFYNMDVSTYKLWKNAVFSVVYEIVQMGPILLTDH